MGVDVSDLVMAIIAAIIFGTIYSLLNRGIASRRKSDKSNDFLYACWIVITVFVALLAISVGESSITSSILFVALTYIFGFSPFLFNKKSPSGNRSTSNKTTTYSDILLRESVSAAQDIISVLAIDKSKYSDKLMFEMVAYSLFITSLHCQREKLSSHKCDETITELTETISANLAKISDSKQSKEKELLTATMSHFYKTHVGKSSNTGEMLQAIATSMMAEYKSGRSEDFYAMTEIVDTLQKLGKHLNETGFTKSLS